MLKLIKIYEKLEMVYDPVECYNGYKYNELFRWEIGTFKSFHEVMVYMENNHYYDGDANDYTEMMKTLKEYGSCMVLDDWDFYGYTDGNIRFTFQIVNK
jgi:hypothetical protein